VPPVDLSELLVIVDNGRWLIVSLLLLLCVGLLLGFLLVENLLDGGFSLLFSGLVLFREPFEAPDVEFLLGSFVLLLDNLDNVHDFCSHALLFDGQIPAGDDFLIGVVSKGKNGSDHDDFVERHAFAESSLRSVHDLVYSVHLVCINHHGSHCVVE